MAGGIFHCLWEIKQVLGDANSVRYHISIKRLHDVWAVTSSLLHGYLLVLFDFRGWVFCLTMHMGVLPSCCLSITPAGNLDNALEVHKDGANHKNSSSCTCMPSTEPETPAPSLPLPESAAGADV